VPVFCVCGVSLCAVVCDVPVCLCAVSNFVCVCPLVCGACENVSCFNYPHITVAPAAARPAAPPAAPPPAAPPPASAYAGDRSLFKTGRGLETVQQTSAADVAAMTSSWLCVFLVRSLTFVVV